MNQVTAENLTAMTGIFPSRVPSDLEMRGAANYEERIRRRLARFLEAKDVEPLKWRQPPSQESLWKKLSEPLDKDLLEELNEWALDAELDVAEAVKWPIQIKAARDYVLGKWPVFRDNSLGLRTFELATDELGDVWHICSTLNDPESMFDDMASLVLLPAQVEAFAAVYPGLYETTKQLASLLIQPYLHVQGLIEPTKWITGEREEQLRVLLQAPQDGPITADSEQQQQDQQEQQAPSGGGNAKDRSGDIRTPSENAAEQRASQ